MTWGLGGAPGGRGLLETANIAGRKNMFPGGLPSNLHIILKKDLLYVSITVHKVDYSSA